MKRLFLLFAAVLMASTGLWAETVDYLYPVYNTDGVPTSGIKEWKTASVDATVVENASEQVTWTAGWYVVTGTNVTLSKGAICSGNVHLILADGAKLTADYADKSNPVIEVSGAGNSLTIYGQTAQTGQLIASGGTNAGIGGGNGESDTNITINGGTITATSIYYGAGIGGGNGGPGSNITINGGTVTATGGDNAAGIGGGNEGDGSNITINGGIVTATGRGGAAGIGGGNEGDGSNITINGGIVTATGRDGAAGIGGGNGGYSSNIFVATTRMVKAGSSENPSTAIANTGADLASVLSGKQYVMVMPPVSYIDENGKEQGATYFSVVTSSEISVTWGEAGKTTWYVVSGADVTLSKGAVCQGDVRLILADGAKLTATEKDAPGIQVSGDDNSLTIYGQAAQSGQLIATGGDCAAGIGGVYESGNGSNITINGGTINAIGGKWGAGIGGGAYGSGSNITINGGTVTANGGRNSAGIGGGYKGSGSNITINGGTVTAIGDTWVAGIGTGGDGSSSSNIFVAVRCLVKAGNSANPTTEIAPDHTATTDLTTDLSPYQYTTVETPKYAVTYGENITVNPAFISGTEFERGTQITFIATDPTADNYNFFGFYEESTFDNPITTGVNGQTYTVTLTNANISVYARYEQYVPANYVYPVYNNPDDVCKGIKEWKTETANAYEVTSSNTPVTLGIGGKTTWYVVTGKDLKLAQGAICQGDVRLILADGAKLKVSGIDDYWNQTYTPGIQVSGEDNSLTIYGQTNQSGELVISGGDYNAGIGGGKNCSGSNITINGGVVTADGGYEAAGIGGGYENSGSHITINGGNVAATGGFRGAGIGGGYGGDGSYITINGGTVRATSGGNAAGIGGGLNGSGSYITVATTLILKADNNYPPTILIENNGSDLAESLAGRQHVIITEPYFNITANQDPDDETHYYSTFYSRTCDYQVPSGVTAYTGEVDGDVLKLTAIADGIIPTGEAVILRLTSEEDITAPKQQLTLTATTTSATKSTDNKLSGTDVAKTLGANEYALSLGQNGVGFYLWEGKSIGAHKAYLTLPASSAKAFTFQFEDETDGIQNCQLSTVNSQLSTYNLNGMRVGKDYKGIVIVNGKKVYQR